MNKNRGQIRGRRQLFATALRYAALGALGTIGGSTLAKRQRLLREGKCTNRGICRGCEAFEACTLPQALSAKQVLARADDDGK